MTNTEWIDLLKMFPLDQQSTLVLSLNTGIDLSIDLILRTEPNYLVIRGRVCGQIDDGRVFFVPYAQITYLNINRVVKSQEVFDLYGESPPEAVVEVEEQHEKEKEEKEKAAVPPLAAAAPQSAFNSRIPNLPAPAPAPTVGGGLLTSRLMSAPTLNMPAPPPNLPTNIPAAALSSQPASPRMPNVPAAALIPQPSTSSATPNPPPARNSILERLRAQRSSIIPPKPPGR